MSKAEELKKELFYQPKHAAGVMSKAEIKQADEFAVDYIK